MKVISYKIRESNLLHHYKEQYQQKYGRFTSYESWYLPDFYTCALNNNKTKAKLDFFRSERNGNLV